MPHYVCRSILVCLTFVIVFQSDGAAFAQAAPEPAVAEDVRLLPYAEPSRRVDIGGRYINLHCSGAGVPTVVLMAGLSSWSAVWYKTQPEIAERTRVCAFDRASYGFSDPPPRPQLLPDAVDDLHAALEASQERGPYVVVGHSLGGLEARWFAHRWPNEVAGLVLVDSSPAAEMLIEADIPGIDNALSMERVTLEKLPCALQAARGIEPSSPEFGDCVQTLPSDTPAAFRQVFPSFFTIDYFAAQLSLLSSLATHKYDDADHLQFGDKPLVVLSAEVEFDPSIFGDEFSQAFQQYWLAHHKALAQLSSRGVHRVIPGTAHMIQLEEPQAVIEAVDEVLDDIAAASN